MSNKYRHNKIKQEHTIIEDVLPFLEDMAISALIKSIIPGRINRRKGSGVPAYLQLKYNTRSGIKLIAKNSSSLQEIFVVTDHPDKTMEFLKKLDYVK
ncbi:DUF2103 domain-containing protein [Halanaerobium sp. Z-7514]|uniref:DUF2103 domain-containing protein n=1 Tax=Halanaerobium polyolivorans TaxID=2886943 RepID=A0AAW4WXZ1_9FIRM|nr:DUF2103 domain-containing protein [Halanaerobium polyolivorans]RQD75084.1 MAG: metal-binding protein [Halanaerobium sp. MSAO_Bac5]